MEFILNNSPELSMSEITKLLFNRNFLSDVQFHIGGQRIYAHALELMKRSVVFQIQLATSLGENQLIAIDDASYDDVYQFVRYIYTDDCRIDNSNAIGLLKLSKRYKVVKLENEIIRVIRGVEMNLNLYEYCLLECDEHYLRRSEMEVMNNLGKCLSSDKFLTIHSVVLESILNSEYSDVVESQLFTALARWISQNSKDNHLETHQQRNHYKHLIRQIRFPLMTADEIFKCTTEYPHLFEDSDFVSLFKVIAQKADGETKISPQLQERTPYHLLYNRMKNCPIIETIFTVACDMLLIGLRFGGKYLETNAELIISQKSLNTRTMDTLTVDCVRILNNSSFHEISLGDSIRLQPKVQYTINIDYGGNNADVEIWCRKENVDVFTNISPKLIQFEQLAMNIFDIYFELTD